MVKMYHRNITKLIKTKQVIEIKTDSEKVVGKDWGFYKHKQFKTSPSAKFY